MKTAMTIGGGATFRVVTDNPSIFFDDPVTVAARIQKD